MFSRNERQNAAGDGDEHGWSAAAENEGAHMTAATVWLLDDDASVLKATARLLRAAGLNVQTFSDPHAFLEKARRQRPLVAVIDVLMPAMNGLEVQTRLREIAPATRTIILTSKDDPVTREMALEAGASAFFLKPAAETEFLGGMQAALNGHLSSSHRHTR